jgi:hypothetical protein
MTSIDPADTVGGVDSVPFAGFDWAVPTLALSVPGLLLILAVVGQGGVGLMWMPIVRRWLGGFGFGRRHHEPARN